MSIILGVHDGLNASACLMIDGKTVFAVQEERLNRAKNFKGTPRRAIKAALASAELTSADIDHVALASRMWSPQEGKNYNEDKLKLQESSWVRFKHIVRDKLLCRATVGDGRYPERLRRLTELGLAPEKIEIIDHHFCHASAAFWGLPRGKDEEVLVLTLDGSGDGICATISIGQNTELRRISETSRHHSLGAVYSRVTHHLGFRSHEHEYKLMGLAPYAEDTYSEHAAEIFRSYITLDPTDPLRFHSHLTEDAEYILPRLRRDLHRHRFDAIAGGLQKWCEELLVEWVRAAIAQTGIRHLRLSGGVFMNVKANLLLSELDEVENLAVMPSCGDESNAFGAAWVLAARLDGDDTPCCPAHYFLGPKPAEMDKGIETLRKAGMKVEQPADMVEAVSDLLAQGKIVARATGPLEFGARALGNRSILADPQNLGVIHLLNNAVKKRDFWMPFAPVVRAEDASRYIVNPKNLPSPYMMLCFHATQREQEFHAALHPKDRTARAQVLPPNTNNEYDAIIDAFGRRTGRSILLNTSFNLHGYPIVASAQDAAEVFIGSELRHMQLGTYLIHKE